MNITVSLRHGPLDIEIEAEDEEDYRQEILDLAEFLKENEEQFGVFDIPSPDAEDELESSSDDSTQTKLSFSGASTKTEKTTEQSGSSQPEVLETEGEKFSSISRRTGVDEVVLARMFDVPDDEEELPAIIIEEFEEGIDVLGPNRTERQARASLMLLYIWEKVRGVDSVISSDLDDSLHMSGVDPENKYNMYNAFDGDADAYFNREGRGRNTKVSLSRRGERVAIDEIEDLATYL